MKRTAAYLSFSAEQVLPLIREAATTWELPVTEVAGTLRVTLEYGEIRVASEGAGTSVRVASEDAGNLQMLRDLLTGQLSAHGLNPVWEGGSAGRQPANQSIARVADIERLSPPTGGSRSRGRIWRVSRMEDCISACSLVPMAWAGPRRMKTASLNGPAGRRHGIGRFTRLGKLSVMERLHG
ncbi:hypothetical protein A8U91_04182 [Halomonas elongata]|uniref:Uncharacterized protein n=1 Tax=Halomonas elongata TaxID=2746 RepID=A0A1B8NYL0_HALEL|nr:hypothetical protein A8U91_04182 [Halomonas elongata]